MRRARTVKKEETFGNTEDFILAKDEALDSDLSEDTEEFIVVENEAADSEAADPSEDDHVTEEVVSE
jgi:hypothetical protein